VSETNSFYDAYPGPRDPANVSGARCTVGIWNLSSGPLVLKVNGKTHALSQGKSVSVAVERRFVWQVEGREAQTEQIPSGEASLEIVIRR
jgi:hypothetical protein